MKPGVKDLPDSTSFLPHVVDALKFIASPLSEQVGSWAVVGGEWRGVEGSGARW